MTECKHEWYMEDRLVGVADNGPGRMELRPFYFCAKCPATTLTKPAPDYSDWDTRNQLLSEESVG